MTQTHFKQKMIINSFKVFGINVFLVPTCQLSYVAPIPTFS